MIETYFKFDNNKPDFVLQRESCANVGPITPAAAKIFRRPEQSKSTALLWPSKVIVPLK